jgi:flavin-dependent dehydrogenase
MSYLERSLDVLVIGGGPAGIAAASELHRLGARIAVVNLRRRGVPRFEMLVPQVRARLEALGVENALLTGRACSGVTGQWGASSIDRSYLFDAHGEGVIVDRNRFDRAMRRQAISNGVRVVDVARIQRPLRCDGDWRIDAVDRIGHDLRLEAAWLVDATGRAAAIARTLGAARRQTDTAVAVVAELAVGQPLPALTMIETQPEGWWYGMPVGRRRAFVGLVTDAAHARVHRAPARWLELLGRTHLAAEALGTHRTLIEAPRVIAASNLLHEPSCGAGWIAVGDAAAAHDPLDGAGVLRAIDSAIEATAALAAVAAGRATDISAYTQRRAATFEKHLERSRTFHSRASMAD